MNYQPRKQRVERLMNQALADRQPHKYIQARFILKDIEERINKAERYRNLFITQIREK